MGRDYVIRYRNTNVPNLRFDKSKVQKKQIIELKPVGLWYAVGNTWVEWCRSEMPDWVKKYNYKIKVDLSGMLVISNWDEVERFTKEYHSAELYGIDWHRIAEKYTGIEINPYTRDFRRYHNGISWYYSWDCPSGCIWHPDAIRGVERVEKKPPRRKGGSKHVLLQSVRRNVRLASPGGKA